MRSQDNSNHDPSPADAKKSRSIEETEETPALPGLSGWKSVYWTVLAVFVLCIVLMRALQEVFS
jgi:hypothetical protein